MFDVKKIQAAIKTIAHDKKIPEQKLVEIIEAAIKTAYKKDYGSKDEEVNVTFNMESGEIEISVEKTVVEEVENPALEISLEDLGEQADDFSVGDVIEIDMTSEVLEHDGDLFGRIASQAARQVIIQKIGESEKERIYELFKDKQGEAILMKVDMVESGKVIFDYNGNKVVLPKSEQVSRDNYVPEQRYYIYVAEIADEDNSPAKVVLSRKRTGLVEAIFKEFVPEIAEGTITIDAIVRQPGVKTKLIVSSDYDEIDPAGTMIGQKGIRVKSVMDELSGEKIDIIPYSDNVIDIISRSLTPATVLKVDLDEDREAATVYIKAGERAKALGKGGVNVNLASQLTGYRLSVEEMQPKADLPEDVVLED